MITGPVSSSKSLLYTLRDLTIIEQIKAPLYTKEAFIISYVYPLHIYVKSEVSGQITHSPMCHFFHIKYCTSKIFNRQESIHYFFMNSSKNFNVKKNNQQNL